jgi:hypothetical protein
VQDERPSVPVFTGAELALADALILIMKCLTMQGALDADGIDTVFADLANRYSAQKLTSAAAMADYLRQHALGEDGDMTLTRLRMPFDGTPEGSA